VRREQGQKRGSSSSASSRDERYARNAAEQRQASDSVSTETRARVSRALLQGAQGVGLGLYWIARQAVRVCVPMARSAFSQLSTLVQDHSSRAFTSVGVQSQPEPHHKPYVASEADEAARARPNDTAVGADRAQRRSNHKKRGPRSGPPSGANAPEQADEMSARLRRKYLRSFGSIPEVVLFDLVAECEMRKQFALPEETPSNMSLLGQRACYIPYELQRIIFDEILTPDFAASDADRDLFQSSNTSIPLGAKHTLRATDGSAASTPRAPEVAVPVPVHIMDSLVAAVAPWSGGTGSPGSAPKAANSPNDWSQTATAPRVGVQGESPASTSNLDDMVPAAAAAAAAAAGQVSVDSSARRGSMLYIPISALGSLWQAISAMSAGGRKRREEAQRIRTYSNAADAMAREDAVMAGLAGADGGSTMASAFATASAIMASTPTRSPSKPVQGAEAGTTASTRETEQKASRPTDGSVESIEVLSRPQASAANLGNQQKRDRTESKEGTGAKQSAPVNPSSASPAPAAATSTEVAAADAAESPLSKDKTRNWWSTLFSFTWPRPRNAVDSGSATATNSEDHAIESIQRLLLSRHYGAGAGHGPVDAAVFDELVDRVEQLTLRAAAEAAMAIRTRKQAIAFLEEVGVAPLLNALSMTDSLQLSRPDTGRRSNSNSNTNLDDETASQRKRPQQQQQREAAFTVSLAVAALANLTNVLPRCKPQILRYPGLLDGLLRILEAPVAGESWEMQGKWSACMLIGTLMMDAATSDRALFFRNRRLVRVLESMAGGTRVGYPEDVARASRRALACLGVHHWRPRVRGQRGLRILALDGGGTRALMSFEILKHLTKLTGCQLHEMFDIICGTSTGAIIAGSLGIRRRPVEEVESLYRELIGKIFAKKLSSAPKMLLTRAYYDTDLFESILKREAGSLRMIDSTMDRDMNYVFFVSSVMNRRPHQLHLFRNYCHAPGQESRYPGTVDATLWQGMRASSAAPTFFSEIVLNGLIHADGALVANNPAGVAAHEARRLFPNVPIELLVSVGTGVAEKTSPLSPLSTTDSGVSTGTREGSGGDGGASTESEAASALREAATTSAISASGGDGADAAAAAVPSRMSWNDVINSIVDSAVGTESVHHILEDVLPADVYFRCNPEISVMNIDEVRPGKLMEMIRCAQDYIAANADRFDELAARLRPKMPQNLLERIRFELQQEASLILDLDDAREGPLPAL
jgi:predicted acylesterase/phospholipase RssA